MATVAPSGDPTADLLQKLSLDSQAKSMELPQPASKTSVIPPDSGLIHPYEQSMTPILPEFMDPSMCYLPNGYPSAPYYYGGYDGSTGEWDEYSQYLNPDGSEMSSGVYADNGLLYHGYGYGPYSPYTQPGSPFPTLAHDGSLYGPQHYQYPSPYFHPASPTNVPYDSKPTTPPNLELSTSSAVVQDPLCVESAKGNSNDVSLKGSNGSVAAKATHQNTSVKYNSSSGRPALARSIPPSFQDTRYAYDGITSPIPWVDGPLFHDIQPMSMTNTSFSSSSTNTSNPTSRNQSLHPHSHLIGMQPFSGMNAAHGYMNHGYINRMYPNKMYGHSENFSRPEIGFGCSGYDSRMNSRGWLGIDNKYKSRGRNNGFITDNIDGLNELNRGPRAKSIKNEKGVPTVASVKGQNGAGPNEGDEENLSPDHEQYNQTDFPEVYNDAKFFIIKSYSEDNVHRSVKYNVWASTPNGNKKLDAAFQEAQKKKPGGCPVFLLFSVNTSGQFVGLAEMVGPVDFQKNLDYWQQDKWCGCFPVKWHIVKDIPNSLLKHIILENNEGKPVTNSRDTQEVNLDQGLQIIKIFKDHAFKTSILDDFGFYEARQKTIQDKKAAKQQQHSKQVWEGKLSDDKTIGNGELRSSEISVILSDLVNETAPDEDLKEFSENSSILKAANTPMALKSLTVSEVSVQSVISNGC